MARPTRDADRRPDPDALLSLVAKEARGKLKVFLGAAPGVGKTYAMLQGAKRLKDEGADVVIGLVETHGRKETASLLAGLEVMPRRFFDHHGRILKEFDIDAALARRPALLVVDELAHTNAPDSRHPKRWQDVEELLDAGIDVWTALNIQHLESLADVVSRITGVTVRETVPDIVLQMATDVVLVDITPDELITRLHDGKIYVPETARRATQNFFSPSNLTALRELALRRTADRVDDQVVDFLRQKAIDGPWGTSEKLLVCIGDDEGSERLVRKTSRLATGLNAGWIALHLERPGQADDHVARAKQLNDSLQLAERLGGEVTRQMSRDFTADILRIARQEHVTQIVVGRPRISPLQRLWRRSLPDQLVRHASDIAVHIVSDETTDQAPVQEWNWGWISRRGIEVEAALAVAAVAVAVGLGKLLSIWLSLPNLSMVFLAAVLICAVRFGTRAAVLAAILSFLAHNFFFIPPIYTFTIAEPHEFFALLVFLAVAMLTGSLAGRLRRQSLNAQSRAETTQSLFDFSRSLSAASTIDDILKATATHLHSVLERQVILMLPQEGDLVPRVMWPASQPLDAAEESAAQWAFDKAEPAGWRTNTLPNLRLQFRPLATSRATIGVCGFEPPDPLLPLTSEAERNLSAIMEQTAIAIDRALLVDQAVEAAVFQENDNIRSTLLASLSHDLRTPLSSIVGAASSLRELGSQFSPEQRDELAASIEQEARRLTGFVSNLLDMSRIESGAIKVKRDWVDVADVIRICVERIERDSNRPPVSVHLATDLPYIRGDAHLLEQVIFNLLDNAMKYGGEEGAKLHARREGHEVVISVTDEGPGIKPSDLQRVFEKFYRVGKSDGRRAGTGLGLSICKGLVEALGGSIVAQSPAIRRRGTRMIVRLPAADPESDAKGRESVRS